MKGLKIVGGIVAIIVVVIALILVVGIPSSFILSAIQERVERDTGYRLNVGGATHIGLLPSLNVTLDEVSADNPSAGDTGSRVKIGSLRADLVWSSLWSGRPHIVKLTLDKPVVEVPLQRERTRQSSSTGSASARSEDDAAIDIDRILVTNGTIDFADPRARVENRIESLNADIELGPDRGLVVTGSARAGDEPIKFNVKSTLPAPPLAAQNIPVDLTLDAPSVLPAALTSHGEVRVNGTMVAINGVSGSLGDAAFNGYATVDLSSKPAIKLDLDFQRLDLGSGDKSASHTDAKQAWSDATIDLAGLNYLDAQLRLSAARLTIGNAQIAPAAVEATLNGGMLKARFAHLGVYNGIADADLGIDVSSGKQLFSLRSDITNVQALPLLSGLAGFDKLDGKMQAKIAVQAVGSSMRAIMSSVTGTTFVVFQDGAIRGINVAKMVRSLTAAPLEGWQENQNDNTDLTQLSASFRIDKGQAINNDLNLVGPLVRMTGTGTIDLAAKSLSYKTEPKLVMSLQGQGGTGAANPVGLGIPVMIEGPWSQPRIYPDFNGVLDNPDAAYAQLRNLGAGLFGMLGSGGGASSSGPTGKPAVGFGDSLGETLGNLIQQGLGSRRDRGLPQSPTPSSPQISPSQQNPVPAPLQDDDPSSPMNGILRDLFNR